MDPDGRAYVAEEPENLILRYLRRLDGKIDTLAEGMSEVKERLTALELGQAATIREISRLAETDARLQASVDRLNDRVGRIERRLDISEHPQA